MSGSMVHLMSPISPFNLLNFEFEFYNFWRYASASIVNLVTCQKYFLIALLRPKNVKIVCYFWRATFSSLNGVENQQNSPKHH